MKIYENNKEHLKAFIKLNEEWITLHFSLEETDKKLAKNPTIIFDKQGYIFSLVMKNEVVGVCALFNEGNGVFELARMAVSASYQGKGLGEKLIKKCISKAHAINAEKIYLVSNTKLKSAIGLYEKYGFVTVQTGQHPIYSRANIVMELKNNVLRGPHAAY